MPTFQGKETFTIGCYRRCSAAGSALAIELDFADIRTAPSWLIGATTFAIDRFVPEVELIYLTDFIRKGGPFRVAVADRPVESGPLRA
ncbi:hypothetical protein ABTM60_19170, partial [Acinetobacter baumannii]